MIEGLLGPAAAQARLWTGCSLTTGPVFHSCRRWRRRQWSDTAGAVWYEAPAAGVYDDFGFSSAWQRIAWMLTAAARYFVRHERQSVLGAQ